MGRTISAVGIIKIAKDTEVVTAPIEAAVIETPELMFEMRSDLSSLDDNTFSLASRLLI